MLTLDSLQELCVHEMSDVMSAELQLSKALPGFIEIAHFAELKTALREFIEDTKIHVERLITSFDIIGQPIVGTHFCKSMHGFLEECRGFIRQAAGNPNVTDAAIVGFCQRAGHYNIASYGSLCSYLRLLGLSSAGSLLRRNLEEEQTADRVLTQIAEVFMNLATAAESES